MGEHFDGVVVDCENEQNATLVFKSARQSTGNQAALAVAIVEGQAGVAKAFRIGANLVLTKPINVEQSKGTLRVARGLLRKAEGAKPLPHIENTAASAPIATAPLRAPNNPSAPMPAAGTGPTPPKPASPIPAMPSPWKKPVGDSAAGVAYASVPNQDSDILESMTEESGDSPDWKLNEKIAGDSSLVESHTEETAKRTPPHPPVTLKSVSPAVGGNAASATAPARISQKDAKTAEPLFSKIARTVGPLDGLPGTNETQSSAVANANPLSGVTLESNEGESIDEVLLPSKAEPKSELRVPAQAGTKSAGSKKVLLAVVASLILGLALYLCWTQLHGKIDLGPFIPGMVGRNHSSAATAPKSEPSPARNLQPPAANQMAFTAPVSSMGPQNPQDQKAGQNASDHVLDAEASDSTNDLPSGSKASSKPASTKAAAHPLIVKSENKVDAAKRSAADTAAPSVVVSADSSSGALPNLIDVSAKSIPVLGTLTISEGISRKLISRKVQPSYPEAALRLHLGGAVLLLATIGKEGNILAVKTVSGEPLLAQAATNAVRQWKYKPYQLNGQPVEFQTQVTINFKAPE
jgi:TonB family protein